MFYGNNVLPKDSRLYVLMPVLTHDVFPKAEFEKSSSLHVFLR